MSNQLQSIVSKIHNTMNNKVIYKADMVGGTHGLTCIFPRLRDIVDYEEQRRVPEKEYPRFIPHPFVVSVQEQHLKDGHEVIAIQTPVYYPTELKHGNGHVVSFELQADNYEVAENFYDNCTIPIKGPGMGFQSTMLMPYSLITHYHDNNVTLAEMGLKRYLMKLSVGTEDSDAIIRDLASGFRAEKARKPILRMLELSNLIYN